MRKITIKLYEFNELDDKAKIKVLMDYRDINVQCDWWQDTYDDAFEIGFKIDCITADFKPHGYFVLDHLITATRIIENHGECCNTHKDAKAFISGVETSRALWKAQNGDVDEDFFFETDEYLECTNEFEDALIEDYHVMLKKQYEFLKSDKTIIETIEINNYEFTADGERFREAK